MEPFVCGLLGTIFFVIMTHTRDADDDGPIATIYRTSRHTINTYSTITLTLSICVLALENGGQRASGKPSERDGHRATYTMIAPG